MTDHKVWLVTGAARGMGVDIAKAALAAGHRVVATARSVQKVTEVLGEHEDLLPVALDITDEASAQAAVRTAVDGFGRIDVLVNNAGMFYAGFFETLSAAQIRAQMEVNFFGTLNVARAVLPVMRAQRSGRLVTITSLAGAVGGEFTSAYAASKFALEGWMESIAPELARFGIGATIVEPGFFRTELLVEGSSTIWPEVSVADYDESTARTIEAWKGMNGRQSGDPAKLAAGLIGVLALEEPPARWVAGADAVEAVADKGRRLTAQAAAHPDLSTGLGHDD
ncbi:SDR family oxidoreductase [Myceligenerans crystallogenes]|uniref:Oxidoreductase n=1 Tax=Myceligenerans crystallogenes TaxID=316335 RepID=A0ABN2N644_9MICO